MPAKQNVNELWYVPSPYLGYEINRSAFVLWERGPPKQMNTEGDNQFDEFGNEKPGEHYYSNDIGARVERPGQSATSSDIVFLGCSWAMGYGNEYEDSFAYKVSQKTGKTSVTLGVGGYGLLQSVRRLEKYVETLRPSVVVIAFGSWLITRSFRNTPFPAPIIQRPVFVYDKEVNDFKIREVDLIVSIATLRNYIKYGKTNAAAAKTITKLYDSLFLLRRLSNNGNFARVSKNLLGKRKEYYINPDIVGEEIFELARKHVAEYCIGRLAELGQTYGFKSVVHFLYPYHEPEMVPRLQLDGEYIEGAISKESGIFIDSCAHEKTLFDSWLREAGHRPDAYRDAFHLSHANHPNSNGHDVIAEAICGQLANRDLLN